MKQVKTIKEALPIENDLNDCFEEARKLLEDPTSILTNIMESMGDGVSVQDLNMRIVYQNRFMIKNFGSHIGDYCYNIYEKRSSACDGCPILESYKTGKVTKALRVGIIEGGLPIRFENIASVIRNEQGKIVAGIELCRIVEDRVRAFDALKDAITRLKQTQSQLIRSEKLAGIGQLAEGVAHEINNPVAIILSNLSIINKYASEIFNYIDSMENVLVSAEQVNHGKQDIREHILQIINSDSFRYLRDDLPEAIEESIGGLHRIKTIVSSLMSFAASSDGERYPIDINEEIKAALLLLENNINKINGQVVKKFSKLPNTYAIPHEMQQMFINMILNACQAIEAEGIIIIKTYAENDYICIEIADTGVGMAENDIKNIFNPFYTTREVGENVGLGLSVAYRIIENHNGSIDVESESGYGTTFTIRLPIISEDDYSVDTKSLQ